jgi:uncharacterized protein YjiS (DUF1127 family)
MRIVAARQIRDMQSAAPAIGSLATFVKRPLRFLFSRVCLQYRVWLAQRHLLSQDDRLLADLGITRSQVRAAVRGKIAREPWASRQARP